MEYIAGAVGTIAVLAFLTMVFFSDDIKEMLRIRGENKLKIEQERTRQAELNAQGRIDRRM